METDVQIDGIVYTRVPLRTHVLTAGDDIHRAVALYAAPQLRLSDLLFLSEKAVACTQNRAIRMEDIHPRRLAIFLSRFVHKTLRGIGLGIPETMEMALRECGTPRILLAAAVSAVGKLFGQRGWFYRVAGTKAAGIDGPCACTLPPYNHCVVLTPKNPDAVARAIAVQTKTQVAIVDINDLGGVILGTSEKKIDKKLLARILKDNPLGQGHEQTPMGIIRRAV